MPAFVFFFVLLFSFFSAHGDPMAGAVSAAMGGTGRAAVQEGESVFLNPAALALMDRVYFGVGYQRGSLKGVHRDLYSVTVTDGTPGLLFSGALAYRRHRIRYQESSFSENEFRVGLGYRFSERLSMGLSFNHWKTENPSGVSLRKDNADVGLLLGLKPNWGLSLVGENLFSKNSNSFNLPGKQSRISLGTQYIYLGFWTFRYEILQTMFVEQKQSPKHRVGMAFGLQSHFYLNLGFSMEDHSDRNWVSAGLSWRGPRLKLAYGLQSEQGQNPGQRHLIDLWFDL